MTHIPPAKKVGLQRFVLRVGRRFYRGVHLGPNLVLENLPPRTRTVFRDEGEILAHFGEDARVMWAEDRPDDLHPNVASCHAGGQLLPGTVAGGAVSEQKTEDLAVTLAHCLDQLARGTGDATRVAALWAELSQRGIALT